MLRLVIEILGSIVAPERCAACDAPVAVGRAFCGPCAASIVPAAPRAGVVAVGAYGGALADAIRKLKYAERPDLARPLGDLLARAGADVGADAADRIVPVPLGSARLVERGYDQAALLAARAARVWGIPASARALRRVRETAPQAGLDRGARVANVDGAFVAARSLAGERIVLIDDVVTTGATTDAAAAAVRSAGGTVVRVVAVAIAERSA